MTEKTKEELDQYKECIIKKIESFKVGNDDGHGNTIEQILGSGDEYVIYKIVADDNNISSSLRVYIDTFDEDDEKGLISNYETIRPCLDDFRSVVHLSHDVMNSMQRAAHAISAAIKGNIDDAKAIFEKITTSIRESHQEQLKFKGLFLSSYIVISIIVSIGCLLIYFNRKLPFVQTNIKAIYFIFMGTAGILGGFISVSTKLHSLSFEHRTPSWQIILHAFERASYSFVLGIIGYLLVKNDMLLAFVKNTGHPIYGYLVCSCAAGVSERFIPDKLVEWQNKS